jgi:translation initiation factor IF-1
MNDKDFLLTRGKVIKLLRGNTYRIECDNGQVINSATVAARFRTPTGGRRAKLVIGDRVMIEISLGDLEKGQIVSLTKKK